jgi:hypothetical protein
MALMLFTSPFGFVSTLAVLSYSFLKRLPFRVAGVFLAAVTFVMGFAQNYICNSDVSDGHGDGTCCALDSNQCFNSQDCTPSAGNLASSSTNNRQITFPLDDNSTLAYSFYPNVVIPAASCQSYFIAADVTTGAGVVSLSDSSSENIDNIYDGGFITTSAHWNNSLIPAVYGAEDVNIFVNYQNGRVITYTYSSLFALEGSWFFTIYNAGTMQVSATNLTNNMGSSNEQTYRGPVFDFSNSSYPRFTNASTGKIIPYYFYGFYSSSLFDISGTNYAVIEDNGGINLYSKYGGNISYFEMPSSNYDHLTVTNGAEIQLGSSGVYLDDSIGSYTTLNNYGGLVSQVAGSSPIITPGVNFTLNSYGPISCGFSSGSDGSSYCIGSTASNLGDNTYNLYGSSATLTSVTDGSKSALMLAGDCGQGQGSTTCNIGLYDYTDSSSLTTSSAQFDQVPYLLINPTIGSSASVPYHVNWYTSSVAFKPEGTYSGMIGDFGLYGTGSAATSIESLDLSSLYGDSYTLEVVTPVTIDQNALFLTSYSASATPVQNEVILTYPLDIDSWTNPSNFNTNSQNHKLTLPYPYQVYTTSGLEPVSGAPTVSDLTLSSTSPFSTLTVQNALGSGDTPSSITVGSGGTLAFQNTNASLTNANITLAGGALTLENVSAGNMTGSTITMVSSSNAIPDLSFQDTNGDTVLFSADTSLVYKDASSNSSVGRGYAMLNLVAAGSANTIDVANMSSQTIDISGTLNNLLTVTNTCGAIVDHTVYDVGTFPTITKRSPCNAQNQLTFDNIPASDSDSVVVVDATASDLDVVKMASMYAVPSWEVRLPSGTELMLDGVLCDPEVDSPCVDNDAFEVKMANGTVSLVNNQQGSAPILLAALARGTAEDDSKTGNALTFSTDLSDLTIAIGSAQTFSSLSANNATLDNATINLTDGAQFSSLTLLSSSNSSNTLSLNGIGTSDSTPQSLVNTGTGVTIPNIFNAYDFEDVTLGSVAISASHLGDIAAQFSGSSSSFNVDSMTLQNIPVTITSPDVASSVLNALDSGSSSSGNTLTLSSSDPFSGLSLKLGMGQAFNQVSIDAPVNASTLTLGAGAGKPTCKVTGSAFCTTQGDNTLQVDGFTGSLPVGDIAAFSTLDLISGSLTSVNVPKIGKVNLNGPVFDNSSSIQMNSGGSFFVNGDYVLPEFTDLQNSAIVLSGYTGAAPTFSGNSSNNSLQFASTFSTPTIFTLGESEPLTSLVTAQDVDVSNTTVKITSDILIPTLIGSGSNSAGNTLTIDGADLVDAANFQVSDAYYMVNFVSGSYGITSPTVMPVGAFINLVGDFDFDANPSSPYAINTQLSYVLIQNATGAKDLVSAIANHESSYGNFLQVGTDVSGLSLSLGTNKAFLDFSVYQAGSVSPTFQVDASDFSLYDGATVAKFADGLTSPSRTNTLKMIGLTGSQDVVNNPSSDTTQTLADIFTSIEIDGASLGALDLVSANASSPLQLVFTGSDTTFGSATFNTIAVSVDSPTMATSLTGSLSSSSSKGNLLTLLGSDSAPSGGIQTYTGLSLPIGSDQVFQKVSLANAVLGDTVVTLGSNTSLASLSCTVSSGSCSAGGNTLRIQGASGDLPADFVANFDALDLTSGGLLTSVDALEMAEGAAISVGSAFALDGSLTADSAIITFTADSNGANIPSLGVSHSTIIYDGYTGGSPPFVSYAADTQAATKNQVVRPAAAITDSINNILRVSTDNVTSSQYNLGTGKPFSDINVDSAVGVKYWNVALYDGAAGVPSLSDASLGNTLTLDGADLSTNSVTVSSAYSNLVLKSGKLGVVSLPDAIDVQLNDSVSLQNSGITLQNGTVGLNTQGYTVGALVSAFSASSSGNVLSTSVPLNDFAITLASDSEVFSRLDVGAAITSAEISLGKGALTCYDGSVSSSTITLQSSYDSASASGCSIFPSAGSANTLINNGASLGSLSLTSAFKELVYNGGAFDALTIMQGQKLILNAALDAGSLTMSDAVIQVNAGNVPTGIQGLANALEIGAPNLRIFTELDLGSQYSFTSLALVDDGSVENSIIGLHAGGSLPALSSGDNSLTLHPDFSANTLTVPAGFTTTTLATANVGSVDLTAVSSPTLLSAVNNAKANITMSEGVLAITPTYSQYPSVVGVDNTFALRGDDQGSVFSDMKIAIGAGTPFSSVQTVGNAVVNHSEFTAYLDGGVVTLPELITITGSDNKLILHKALERNTTFLGAAQTVNPFSSFTFYDSLLSSVEIDQPRALALTIGAGTKITQDDPGPSGVMPALTSGNNLITVTSSGNAVRVEEPNYGKGNLVTLATGNALVFDIADSDIHRFSTLGSSSKWLAQDLNGGTIIYDNPACIILIPQGKTTTGYDATSCQLVAAAEGVYDTTSQIFGYRLYELNNRLSFKQYGLQPHHTYVSKGKGTNLSPVYDMQDSGVALLYPLHGFDLAADATYSRYTIDTGVSATQKSLYVGLSKTTESLFEGRLMFGYLNTDMAQDVVVYGDEVLATSVDINYGTHFLSASVSKLIPLSSIHSYLLPSLSFAWQNNGGFSHSEFVFESNIKTLIMPQLTLQYQSSVLGHDVQQSLFTLFHRQLSGEVYEYSYKGKPTSVSNSSFTSGVMGYAASSQIFDNTSLNVNTSFSTDKVFTIGVGLNYNFTSKKRLSHNLRVESANSKLDWMTIAS